MQATLIDGMILICIIASMVAFYCSGYSSGSTAGTNSGYLAGFSAGKSAGVSEVGIRLRACYQDAEQIKQLREIERRDHKAALESIMLDCDERITLFARRSNPFGAVDCITLQAAANQLNVAANTYTGLHAPDEARFARQMQQKLLNLAEQLRIALEHSEQQALPPLAANSPAPATTEAA